MKKNLFFVFMCMIALAFSFSSCENEAKEKLEKIVSEENAKCPIYDDEGIVLTSITLEGDEVILTYVVNEDYIDMDYFRVNKAECKREMIRTIKSTSSQVVKLCKDADCKIVVRIKGDTGQVVTVEASPDEM